MMISLMPSFGVFADSTANHWANETLQKWQQQGMLKGDTQGNVQPDKPLSRAEFIALVNRMKGYTATSDKVKLYTDVSPTAWYYNDVAIALEAGYINGTSETTMAPMATITRQEAMAIMSRIEKLAAKRKLLTVVKDASSVANWAKDATSACINAGYITGYQGNITPQANITKAEAVVLLDRILSNTRVFSFAGNYGGAKDAKAQYDHVTILANGVKLNHAKIAKDLVIDKAVADGEVYLDSVDILGNLYAYGGGINSLYFNSVTVGASLVVKKYDNNIRIYVSGESKVNVVVLKSGAMLVTQELKDGAIEKVEIPQDLAQGAKVNLVGSFNKVVSNSQDLNLNLKGEIKHLTLKKNMVLEGKGEIAKLSQDATAKLTVNKDDYKKGRSAYSGLALPGAITANTSSGSGSSYGGGSSSDDDDQPAAATLQSLSIKVQPNKTNYYMAEQLDLTGLVVEALYSDNTKKVLNTDQYTVNGYDANKLGEQTLTINAQAKTVTFTVKVYKALPQGSDIVKVTTAAAISFENGIALDQMQLPKVLEVVYNLAGQTDDSIVNVIWQAISGYDQDQKSEQQLTVDGTIVVPDGVTVSVSTSTAIKITVLAKNWQVTFETPEGAAKIDSQTVKHQAKATQPASPAIEGYTFVGYKLENNATAADFDFNTPITNDTKVYAVYKINVYDVVFTIDPAVAGITAPQTFKVEHGKLATKPAVIKNGDKFSEWYSDAALTQPFDFNQPIKQNTTLYVKWVKDPVLMDAARALNFDTIKGENKFDWSVNKNLNLMTSLPNNISLSWASDNTAVINTSGVVKRPVSNDKDVTLTATLTRNGVSTTKQITVTVAKKGFDVMQSDYVDPRFAAGYPKFSVNEDNEVILKIKLKPGIASAANPVEAFVNWREPANNQNYPNVVDPYKVHLGFESDTWDYMRNVFYQKITDDAEYLIETDIDLSAWRREYAFVLRQNNSFNAPNHSAVPTQATCLSYDLALYNELHQFDLDTWDIYLNKAKDKIVIYYDDSKLDKTSVPDVTDYELLDENNQPVGSVTKVTIVNGEDGAGSGDSDLSWVVLDVANATMAKHLKYSGTAIQDISVPPNKAETFEHEIMVPTNQIEKVVVSSDHTKIAFEIDGFGWYQELIKDSDFTVKSQGEIIGVDQIGSSHSDDSVEKAFKLDKPIDPANFTIEMKQPKTNVALDVLKCDQFIANQDNVTILEPLTFNGRADFYDNGEIVVQPIKGLLNDREVHSYYLSLDIAGQNYRLLGDFRFSDHNDENKRWYSSYTRVPDEYSYYMQVILPKINEALLNNKSVKLIYDTKPNEFNKRYNHKLKDAARDEFSNGLVNGKYQWELQLIEP